MVSRRRNGLLAGLLALACGLAPATRAPAAQTDAPELRLEVLREAPSETPYPQEMVLLALHGSYQGTIAREELELPASPDFGWIELGADHWDETGGAGGRVRTFERGVALFARHSGRLVVPPFVHHLTLIDGQGQRYESAVASAPLLLEVQPKPAGIDWWLPAREVQLSERWSKPPGSLAPGELAQRSVTLEAAGVGPELLPPAPVLRAAGLSVFSDPEERATRLTPEGPVSSVTWHWTVRLFSDTTPTLAALSIPWFDTKTREMRQATLPPRRLGRSAAGPGPERGLALRLAVPGGFLAGFLLGLLLLLPGWRLRPRAEILAGLDRFGLSLAPEARALRTAARQGDPAAVRAAALRLLRRRRALRRDPPLPQAVELQLRRLDRLLFGPPGTGEPPDLGALARGLLRARRGAL
ncbi:Oxygen tolerance [Tistlia consotensis]|uniref:Oxygen tolerance n=1 Tax=Tistlia consotensis USBA 355 TaxID=560819 RepID=A0A1Y6CAP6_9PROT|nr:BatD family protein [Tistlia consotensis]SMF51877.1 Oxygen tolerance [Tistlia consotensis USBA 355]SNR83639.1 Oxygen tolerance [Tistlia consotensis]